MAGPLGESVALLCKTLASITERIQMRTFKLCKPSTDSYMPFSRYNGILFRICNKIHIAQPFIPSRDNSKFSISIYSTASPISHQLLLDRLASEDVSNGKLLCRDTPTHFIPALLSTVDKMQLEHWHLERNRARIPLSCAAAISFLTSPLPHLLSPSFVAQNIEDIKATHLTEVTARY